MAMPRIVLASASSRRRELLGALGLAFEVDAPGVDETTGERDPARIAEGLAIRKARAGAVQHPDALVIGSDTVVALDGEPLGKPVDVEDARRMLTALRNRSHEVVTGVAVTLGARLATSHQRTIVQMRDYADAEIDAFIATGSPFDKAGGYAIQDETFAPVARFEGCQCNVIGLPLGELRRLLDLMGVATDVPAVDCSSCSAGLSRA